ncbi:MAG TPA: hypothetical protein VN660_00420 [Steroidobacteraceae bacterium]|nr:hypothetical protein [Steroidobacteraceae bacterium]
MNRHPLRRLLRPVALVALLLGGLPFTAAVMAAPAKSAVPAAASAPAPTPGAAAAPVTTAPAPSVVAAPAAAIPASATAASAPAASTAAAVPASASGTRSLDEQIQDLKRQTVELNRDLFVLEEDLLFPANTQVAVFVSVDVGNFFALDSIDLKIDNKDVSNYLYTPREVAALLRGGVQRLYVGNLKAGPHELVAFFNGKGPNARYYRRAASLRFEKGLGAKYLELKVTDHQHAQEPEFEIKDWQ